MMRTYKLSFTIALLLFFVVSCDQKDDDSVENSHPKTIQFISKISDGNGDTRVLNTAWEAGDRIGIFMKTTGETLSAQSIAEGTSNREYVTSAGGIFAPGSESQTIRFPQDGSGVDFIAYYPYTVSLNNFTYAVDVSDQSDLAKIDLLYAENIVNASLNNPHNTLLFSRQLAKIVININASSNVSSLNGLEVTLAGTRTRAGFNLADGTLTTDNGSIADIGLHTTITSNTAQAEAILIPDEGGAGRVITFRLQGVGTFEWNIPNDVRLEKGKRYTYSITLNAEGIDVNTSGWIETPVMSSTLPDNLVYISHMMPGDESVRNYSMLYDKTNKLAYWVAYPLHAYYMGSSGRTNDWGYDPKIDTGFQPLLKNGFGVSGIDRGHQIPSADRTNDRNTNSTTFYYTNMTAQNSTLNQGMWANLEERIRTWTASCDTLYVVTGAMITSATNNTIEYVTDNSGMNVAKPQYYYKALAQRVGNTYYTLAFRMNNISISGSYNTYRLTVKELEDETGMTFFPSIPSGSKNEIIPEKWN